MKNFNLHNRTYNSTVLLT